MVSFSKILEAIFLKKIKNMLKKLAFFVIMLISLSYVYGQNPIHNNIANKVSKFPYVEIKEMKDSTYITGNLAFTNNTIETIDTVKVIALISSTESLLVQSINVLAVRSTKTMTTLDSFGKLQTYTKHLKYLNVEKGDLPKQIIVWLTKSL